MKRFLALFLAILTVISLSACNGGADGPEDTTEAADVTTDHGADDGTGNADTEIEGDETTTPDPSKVSPDGYEFDAIEVGGESEVFIGALNLDKLYISSQMHLPIVKLDSRALLDNFINMRREAYHLNSTMNPYDGSLSFVDATKKYDEKFFEENTLLLVEVKAHSGSLRYGVREVYIKDKYCTVYIDLINDPPQVTHDIANWFIVMPVSKSEIKNVTEFDAIYRGVK